LQIAYELKVQSQVKTTLDRNRQEHEIQTEFYATKIGKEISEYTRLESKHSRCLTKILERVEKCHYTSRVRFIVTQWREYVDKRKRSIAMLEKAMKKSLAQDGFNEIKWFSRDLIKARKLDRVLSKYFSAFSQFALRSQFSRWKS
jgi:hypothetical protein